MLDTVQIKDMNELNDDKLYKGNLSGNWRKALEEIVIVLKSNNCSIWAFKLISDYIIERALVENKIDI